MCVTDINACGFLPPEPADITRLVVNSSWKYSFQEASPISLILPPIFMCFYVQSDIFSLQIQKFSRKKWPNSEFFPTIAPVNQCECVHRQRPGIYRGYIRCIHTNAEN